MRSLVQRLIYGETKRAQGLVSQIHDTNNIAYTRALCVRHDALVTYVCIYMAQDSAVGIATVRSGDRIPVGARFSAPVQTGPGVYPASYTMGTGSFPGVKRPGRGADHLPPSKCRRQERVGLYLYSPSGSSWPVMAAPYVSLDLHLVYPRPLSR